MSQEQSEMPQAPSGQTDRAEGLDLEVPVLDCYECAACGYVYEPQKGDVKSNVAAGTAFPLLEPTWKCPVCGVPKSRFQNIGRAGAASGFKENLKYGFGVNTLTPGQKNLLIFGSLLLAVLFFLSLYTLE
jgi:rubredoxin